MITQRSPFATPAREPRCRDCGGMLLSYPRVYSWLCDDCLERCPKRTNKDGTTSYLTCEIAPANWRELLPWRDDFRMVNGVRQRSACPGYYRDADGVIWKMTQFDVYEQWSEE